MKNKLFTAAIALGLMAVGSALVSQRANAFILTSRLNGDPRLNNPDSLFVDVSIKTGADIRTGIGANVSEWTVDLNLDPKTYSNPKLDAFFFNLAGDNTLNSSTYAFAASTQPDGNWGLVKAPVTNATGSGGATFDFEIDKTINTATNVTNSNLLVFRVTKNTGIFTLADFTGAEYSKSSDLAFPSVGFQMAAHIQNLEKVCPGLVRGECQDSGFSVGNYTSVPTPAAVLPILGGLFGLASRRKKEIEQA